MDVKQVEDILAAHGLRVDAWRHDEHMSRHTFEGQGFVVHVFADGLVEGVRDGRQNAAAAYPDPDRSLRAVARALS